MPASPPQHEDPRKVRARATRRRIVEAAYRLFIERGYSVPLSAIAAGAGVAVQTIYFTFGTKFKLFTEAFDYAVVGDDSLTPPEVRMGPALEAALDGRAALDVFMIGTIPIFRRVAPLWGIFQTSEREIVALRDERERWRYDGYRRIVDVLAGKGGLKPGLTRKDATDILFTMTAPDVYRSFVLARGWSADRWRLWITDVLGTALLSDSRPRRTGKP